MEKQKISFWKKNALTIKFIVVGIIILLLLIPKSMVRSLIYERKSRQTEVEREISNSWSENQVISGPVLSIPYMVSYQDEEGKTHRLKRWYHQIPENLYVICDLTTEIRYRGIFNVVVYHSVNNLNGNFSKPNFDIETDYVIEKILWDEAKLSISIKDIRGVEDKISIDWSGQALDMKPGNNGNLQYSVLQASLPISVDEFDGEFALKLKVKGSKSHAFNPLAQNTRLTMQGEWPSPKFFGDFIPSKRMVDESGFEAEYSILEYNRAIQERWINHETDNLNSTQFGVELLQVNDHYQQTERSAKYGILILALTFLAFFLIELILKLKIHPIQYLLIGFALILFYVLLLSFSEHIGFDGAYTVASIGTIGLITLYAKAIFTSWKPSLIIAVSLSLLYTFIFVIIQLEDYALLAGSIGLFVILAFTMYLTKKIKWYVE